MLDLSQPLVIVAARKRGISNFDPSRDKHDLRFPQVRVICQDRVSPGGFTVVALAYDPNATFGSEEYVVKINPEDGAVSHMGFTDNFLINTNQAVVSPEPIYGEFESFEETDSFVRELGWTMTEHRPGKSARYRLDDRTALVYLRDDWWFAVED